MRLPRGFTLIELMIVIAIIGIIAAFALPQLNNLVMNGRLSTRANELQGLLQIARSEAVTNKVETRVCGTTDQANCNTANWELGAMAFRDRDSNGIAAADELIRVLPATTNNITVRGLNGPIRYATDGTLLIMPPTLRICDPRGVESSRQIFMNASGQSRVHQGNFDADSDGQEDDGVCP